MPVDGRAFPRLTDLVSTISPSAEAVNRGTQVMRPSSSVSLMGRRARLTYVICRTHPPMVVRGIAVVNADGRGSLTRRETRRSTESVTTCETALAIEVTKEEAERSHF